MRYFASDVKKILKNRLIMGLFALMLAICIIDPFINYLGYIRNPGFGDDPFLFWLLIDSSGIGFTIYATLFVVFPVIATGLIYYYEKQSSVYVFLVSRGSRIKYLFSKVVTAFITTFLIFLIPLTVNVLITWIIFPGAEPLSEQYYFRVPDAGTFAAYFYNISPLVMAIVYTLLNAFVVATLTVLSLGIHMVFRFKNQYLALLIPPVGLFLLSYANQMISAMNENSTRCLNIVIQPQAASALVELVTFKDLFVALASLIVLTFIVVILGFWRNRESL